jgi:hypothetical protein
MTESAQLLLIVVVTTLTILLTVVGVEAFLILKEVKKSVEKINKILDDAGMISESVAKPIVSVSSSLGSLSGIAGLLGLIFAKKRKKKEEEEDERE